MNLTYAIGDIHGCYEELNDLLGKIERHAAGRSHKIITLGDYCDRGPKSKDVLDLLIAREDIIRLKGNHEDMLLAAADAEPGADYHFESNGGYQTNQSFGVHLARDIDAKYLTFLRKGLRRWYEDDLRVFVHAGIDPTIPNMEEQSDRTLLWVREPFLSMIDKHFKHVVHGHTPQVSGQPQLKHNRTNLDTCCFHTGILTAGVFNDTQAEPVEIIQVRHGFKKAWR